MEQHFVEEPCQEGWHRPVLSLFAKVFTVFSCKLPKVTCFQKRACRMAGRTGSHLQQRETERSRRGTPCCTYRYRMWIFQGVSYSGVPPVFVLILHPFCPTALLRLTVVLSYDKGWDVFRWRQGIRSVFRRIQKIRTLLLSEKSSDFVVVVHLQGLEPWAH